MQKNGLLDKTNYLSEYIELELPQALGAINNKPVDNHSSILLELNGSELDENSIFTIPNSPINVLSLLVEE